MKLSEQRKLDLYRSIRDPIMQLRIEQSGGLSIEEMDDKLIKLEQQIWQHATTTLNLQD